MGLLKHWGKYKDPVKHQQFYNYLSFINVSLTLDGYKLKKFTDDLRMSGFIKCGNTVPVDSDTCTWLTGVEAGVVFGCRPSVLRCVLYLK